MAGTRLVDRIHPLLIVAGLALVLVMVANVLEIVTRPYPPCVITPELGLLCEGDLVKVYRGKIQVVSVQGPTRIVVDFQP